MTGLERDVEKCARLKCKNKVTYYFTTALGIFRNIDNEKSGKWYPACSEKCWKQYWIDLKNRKVKKDETITNVFG